MSKVRLKSRIRTRIINDWRLMAIAKLKQAGVLFEKQPKNAVIEYIIKERNLDVIGFDEFRAKEKQKIIEQRESAISKEVSLAVKPTTPVINKPKALKPTSTTKPVGYKQKSHKSERVNVENTNEFYNSWAWKDLRLQVIKKYDRRCMCCGASPNASNDVVIHVDHIKPIRLYPELALDISNLQVLCGSCNMGKGYWDETDFRLP